MWKSQMKIMLITFFNVNSTVHFQFISQGLIVNQAHYVEILKQLCEAVRRKRLELWSSNLIPHSDNAPANKALSAKQFPA
jgi:hypothetical protein